MKNIKTKGIHYMLAGPIALAIGLVGIFVGSVLPKESFIRTVATVGIGFPLLFLGMMNTVPGLIYGYSLYRRSKQTHKPPGDTHGAKGIPVRIVQSWLMWLFGNTAVGSLFGYATDAMLTWSNATHTLTIKQLDGKSRDGVSVRADYSEISRAALEINRLTLTIKDKRYTLYARSAASDTAYAASVAAHNANIGPSMVIEAVELEQHGVRELIDGLRYHGVYIVQPDISRAIEIGAVIASVLFVAFWSVFIIIGG